jgi:hypothetical protein
MNLVNFNSKLPNLALEPGTPLWQVVPTRDADGKPLADFMMLIPGLRKRPQHEINATLNNIQKVLEQYNDVVFANFNLKINVLWVLLNCRPGIILKMAASIQDLVPEALLVAHQ